MSDSYFLDLPFLASAQNQKHITMNECLNRLDILVQFSVKTKDIADRPANPLEGDRFIVAASGAGDWLGQDGKLSVYLDGVWTNISPRNGWLCWVEDVQQIVVFMNGSWQEYSPKKTIFSPDVSICEEMGYGQTSTNAPNTGWNQRYLNLMKINNLGAGVVFDQTQSRFKLPVGKYWVKIMAAAMRVGKHKADLKNLVTGQHLIQASCEHSEAGGASSASLCRSMGEGELIVDNASDYFGLMHHVETGGVDAWQFGSAGEGPSTNCKIELWKL
ncbi:MAG: DUF2793 domain-containing protein [Rhizobiales bacterium]|nr:DUF2793 domain-containing protein [Hyphomicrobiales bacterium]